MKTPTPKPPQIPRLAPVTARGIKTLLLMKYRLGILRLFVVLCSTFALTAAFGQATFTWTGGTAAGNVLDAAANWTTNGSTPAAQPPSPGIGDTAQWDGGTTSNLVLNYTGTTPSFSGNPGANFVLTANQIN